MTQKKIAVRFSDSYNENNVNFPSLCTHVKELQVE